MNVYIYEAFKLKGDNFLGFWDKKTHFFKSFIAIFSIPRHKYSDISHASHI